MFRTSHRITRSKSQQKSEMGGIIGALHRDSLEALPHKSLRKIAPDAPYETFVRELNIKLPTPKEKYYQFLQISPFNRQQNHIDLIEHFLSKVKFFKMHPPTLIASFAHKIKLIEPQEADNKLIIVLQSGEAYYQGIRIPNGYLVTHDEFESRNFSADPSCRLLAMPKHEYNTYLHDYIVAERQPLWNFINSIQTLKIFNQKALSKFADCLGIHYYLKGEKLFSPSQPASCLMIVQRGKAVRKVIVEIDKINKIPYQKYTKILRVMSKSYEHQIEFEVGDLVGVGEIIDDIEQRKQLIEIQEDSVILSLDRPTVEQAMDDYIRDRLRKYNLKKYPLNYDQLCENYTVAKAEMKKMEERKIIAMQSQRIASEGKRRKINSIIKVYRQNIKKEELKNLLFRRLSQRHIHHE